MTAVSPLPYVGFAPGGNEQADAEFLAPDRVVAYLRTMAPPGIWSVIGEAYPCDFGRTFSTPAADGAPWTLIDGVDVLPTHPEAGDFLGVIITNIQGLDSTLSRDTTRKLDDLSGGIFEEQSAGPRTVTVKGVMVATSSCGLEWGERWLTETLAPPPCEFCQMTAFSFRTCCPEENPAEGLWFMYDAALCSGPTVRPLSRVDASESDLVRQSCYLAEVEFEIGSENPFLYKPWELVGVVPSGIDDAIPEPFDARRLGIDGVIVMFGAATAGQISAIRNPGEGCSGDEELLFTLNSPPGGLVYDSSRKRVVIAEADGTAIEDAIAAAYIITSIDGAPMQWLELDSACPTSFCALALTEAGSVTYYRQHKEYGA